MSRLRIDVHTRYLGGAIAAWRERTGQQIRGGYRISVPWSPDTAIEFMDTTPDHILFFGTDWPAAPERTVSHWQRPPVRRGGPHGPAGPGLSDARVMLTGRR